MAESEIQQALIERRDQQIQDSGEMLNARIVRARVNTIQSVMQAVMKADTHYGKLPGTNQPTLYKAGAEILLTTFMIAVLPDVEDLSTQDAVRFRVFAKGVHQTSGRVIGIGVGECSSDEEKYRWRAAVCDEEYMDTPEDRRRVKYKQRWGKRRGERETVKIQQVRTEPADLSNTVLKMAKKRALVDLTLTATAASDMFAQDLEDLPEHLRATVVDDHRGPEPEAEPVQENGTARTRQRMEAKRAPSDKAPNAPEAGPAEDPMTEEEVAAMFDNVDDIADLNFVSEHIERVADFEARARLRKTASAKAKELANG